MKTECPSCGNSFQQVSIHISKSDCEYPSLSKQQKDIVTGVLMGDGHIMCGDSENSNSSLCVRNINKEYLLYLDEIFPFYGLGVDEERVIDGSGNILWCWRTRRSPEFNEFRNWYSSCKKIFPKSIKLSPTILKHWYVCDGSYDNYGSNARGHLQIAICNEIENKEKIKSYFDGLVSDVPRFTEKDVRFTADSTEMLHKYMGEPLPGFEYKW